MKLTKEQKPTVEPVPSVDVELNEEQLEIVAGGIDGDCTGPPIWGKPHSPDSV